MDTPFNPVRRIAFASSSPRRGLVAAACVVAWLVAALGYGQQPDGGTSYSDADIAFFEQRIRPVLVQHCYECHSAEAQRNESLQGGLRLDSRAAILSGGDSGKVVNVADVRASLLLEALRYESLEMPPEGQLPDRIIADFEDWIRRGLPDPRHQSPSGLVEKRGVDFEQGRRHWCYQPIKSVDVPRRSTPRQSSLRVTSPIDAFILDRLDRDGIEQVAIADRTILIRRLHFDLVGLPPSPQQIEAFLNDTLPRAYERLVDQLLASPRFGERWGRHWLDVVRYAESISLRGQIFREAWRYRDYVIDSFNQDRPFDQFIREQIGGDLLPAESLDQQRRQRIATTFLVLGNHNMEDQDKQKLRMDVVDEQLDVIGRGILAQTITCARCHDHKFDPIPTRDYYALAGILRSTQSLEHANVSKWLERPLPGYSNETSGSATPARSMTVQEAAEIGGTHVHIRGSVHQLGEPVPRGFLQVVPCLEPDSFSDSESGRRQLADWLTSRQNPLTSRVMVNRLWQWLFGYGLVRTPDNFGTTGAAPSHPRLLDYLAQRFMQSGWSVKQTIREIVLTRAYRLSSDPERATSVAARRHAESRDVSNRLLWRGNRRRLDAESLLDSMLDVGGQLQAELGGNTIRPGTKVDFEYSHHDNRRRAVYWPVFRNSLPRIFTVFDFANPSMVVGTRNRSSTASQSLFLLNNPFVVEQSRHVAERLLSGDTADDNERTQHVFALVLGRPPSDAERLRVVSFVRGANGQDSRQVWSQVVQSLFASIDFRYLR